MKRIVHGMLLACLSLAVSACATDAAPSPAAASSAPAVVSPLEAVAVSDQALRFGYESLNTVAYSLDALIETGAIKRGSPKAKALADAMEGTLTWFNRASALQHQAGQAAAAYAAWQQAQAGLANLRNTLASK